MAEYPVLIGGQWRPAKASKTFQAVNPATGEPLTGTYPVSGWEDCDAALAAAADAANELRRTSPDKIARFLTRFAERIEEGKTAIVEQAHLETALPKAPRLADVELPRSKDRGRCRRSTRKIRFDRVSSRLGPSSCSARTIFPSHFPAWPAAISPQPLPPATRSLEKLIRCIRARDDCLPKRRLRPRAVAGFRPRPWR